MVKQVREEVFGLRIAGKTALKHLYKLSCVSLLPIGFCHILISHYQSYRVLLCYVCVCQCPFSVVLLIAAIDCVERSCPYSLVVVLVVVRCKDRLLCAVYIGCKKAIGILVIILAYKEKSAIIQVPPQLVKIFRMALAIFHLGRLHTFQIPFYRIKSFQHTKHSVCSKEKLGCVCLLF